LQQIIPKYSKKISFILVAVDESGDAITRYLSANGLSDLPVYYGAANLPIRLQYIPTVVLLNADGSVNDSWVGVPSEADFTKKLDALTK
jgi:hypothetical protein